MQPCEIVTFVTAIACSIFQCCDEQTVEIMGAIFTQLGDTLVTALTADQICNAKENDIER